MSTKVRYYQDDNKELGPYEVEFDNADTAEAFAAEVKGEVIDDTATVQASKPNPEAASTVEDNSTPTADDTSTQTTV